MLIRYFVSLAAIAAFLLLARASHAGTGTLPSSVKAALDRFDLDGRGLSLLVQEVDTGNVVLSYNADTPRNPASTIKLFTSMAALDLLTPAHHWYTELHADGELKNGELLGDLWMKGGGDPFMPLERIWLMVHQLRMTGLRSISGDLFIDQSYFDPIIEDPAAFDGQGLRAYNVVPAALVSNFNVSRLLFRPSSKSNRVDVEVIPNLPGLTIQNNLRTVNKSCRGYNRGIALNLSDKGDLILDGRFPARCKVYSMSRSVMPRDAYTAGVFRLFWEQSGGQWNGKLRAGVREFSDRPLLNFQSVSLSEAVRSINKYSNNLMTRMLFLSIGANQLGLPGNTARSREAINQWLDSHKLERSQFFIDNGAGSSRATRATATQFAALLDLAWNSPYMPELIASMAISGQDGTLARRAMPEALKGRAHLKTGRLDHVVAVAGYLQAKSNKRYIVVAQHNAKEAHRGSGHAVQDALLNWLYSRF